MTEILKENGAGLRCDICGHVASYVINLTLLLCDDCYEIAEDDFDGSEIIDCLEDDMEDENDESED